MKIKNMINRLVALLVLLLFSGCVSSTPQNVRIVVNEPEAEIEVNGEVIGRGEATASGLIAKNGNPAITVRHPDYLDYPTVIVPDGTAPMSKKEKRPLIILSILGIVGGTILFSSGLASAISASPGDDTTGIVPGVIGGSLAAGSIAPLVLAISDPPTRIPAFKSSYPIDISIFRKYDELGYSKTTGYNKAGFNSDGFNAEGDRYIGPVYNWVKNGFGLLEEAGGSRYYGGFLEDRFSGLGAYSNDNGEMHIGFWADGKKDGVFVTLFPEGKQIREVWEQGELVLSAPAGKIRTEAVSLLFFGPGVSGGWADGRGDAVSQNLTIRISDALFEKGNLISGKMVLGDGSVYTGTFEDFVLVQGQVSYSNGTFYKGTLTNGIPDGRGTMKSPDGTVYEGELENGLFEGNGVLTLANGDIYEGPFAGGKPHGEGIYKNQSENLVERCEFYEGRRIDQAYVIRIERAKEEERKRLEEEHAKKLAEERARQERERQKRLEEQRKAAESNKFWGSLATGALTAGMASSAGMDTGEALLLGASTARDVYEGTDGTYTRSAGEFIIANRESMAEYETKYGASDLSYTSEYSKSFQTPGTSGRSPESRNTNTGPSEQTASVQTSAIGTQSVSQAEQVLKQFSSISKNFTLKAIPASDNKRTELKGSNSFRNPQPGIASLEVRYAISSMMGEPLTTAEYIWTPSDGYPDTLPGQTRLWLQLSNSYGSVCISFDLVNPKAEKWSSDVQGSPDWDELFAEGFQGTEAVGYYPEDTAKAFWAEGLRVTGAWLGFR